MVKTKIKNTLKKAVKKALGIKIEPIIDWPEDSRFGDYSSNVALVLYSKYKDKFKNYSPLRLGEKIINNLDSFSYLKKAEVVAPGFINFFFKDTFLQKQVKKILEEREDFGISKNLKKKNKKKKIQVEFISANPTGPLTAGNCRGGFAGDVLSNILEHLGYQVKREYYINDRGTQIERLARSVEARYWQLKGKRVAFPKDGYCGNYIKEIAKEMIEKNRQDFNVYPLKQLLKRIKKTVKRMGIHYDCWFSESSLYQSSEVKTTLNLLKQKRLVYKKNGALWFCSQKYGDEKDRVLIRSNGESTYFLSDVAYHFNKFKKRKFDKVILFWGADHSGYVKRFLAMVEAIGYKNKAEILICQLLKLTRKGKEIKMSKRKGEFITVDDLLDEIGLDAARFHFLLHSLDTPMILDLSKAKEQSVHNPIYYVQYAYARIESILRKAPKTKINPNYSLLSHPLELALIKKLIKFPEVLEMIEKTYQLNRLPSFTLELADSFHRFYENCRVINQDKALSKTRLNLVKATKIILAQSLKLMGVSRPKKM